MRKKEPYHISPFLALLPVLFLIAALSYNVYIYKSNALDGSNQFILLIGAAFAACIGFLKGVPYNVFVQKISKNIKSTAVSLLILIFVGALSGTWLLSGVIPGMIYYGLKFIHPSVFLVVSLLVSSLVSISTGSSWTTSATVGVALIGVGDAMGIPPGMTAGAIISGAYFGDKMSPLSDTTTMASAVSGTDLFTHIRYMFFTTVPSLILTFAFFAVAGFFIEASHNQNNVESMLKAIDDTFNIHVWLFLLPLFIVFLILRKVQPLVALFIGVLLGAVFALIFQPDLVIHSSGLQTGTLDFASAYKGLINAITIENRIPTSDPVLAELFKSGGMYGMMSTVWLILCAMAFGGVLDAIGALKVITGFMLKIFHTVFGLFASTVASCLVLNLTASDQYLAIVLPGSMYKKAFKNKGLAPENLSRTLEDSGTVTSALIPWNTCGAYHSSVLGVSVGAYLPYAIFNLISPFMTLLFAALKIKIKTIRKPL